MSEQDLGGGDVARDIDPAAGGSCLGLMASSGWCIRFMRFSYFESAARMNIDKLRLKIYLTIFSLLLVGGSVSFVLLEGVSAVDGVYFAIVTMATVGYGDISPQTVGGKIVAIVMIVGGVGTFLGVVASMTEIFVQRHDAQVRRQKVNMVAGLFFSELGTDLIRRFARLDADAASLAEVLGVSPNWVAADFARARRHAGHHPFVLDLSDADLAGLRERLQQRADLLLRLLENPILLEHGEFTDLLRAVFHLRDELVNRRDLSDLPAADRRHLAGDIVRVYRRLIDQWLPYMQYMQEQYGYLFSLAVRTLPFNPKADAVVREDGGG